LLVSLPVHRRLATWLGAIGLASVVPAASSAYAADTKTECIDAHETAQALRKDGHLRAARTALLRCTRPICPAVIQRECGPWLEQLAAEQPSIVLSLRDARGADQTDARVSIDGERRADRLDGHPLEIDPGDHLLRVELPGGQALERRITIRDGEQRRALALTQAKSEITAPPPSSVPRTSSANTIAGSIAAGAGVVTLGVAAAFTVLQNAAASNAHAACPDGCAVGSSGATIALSDVATAKDERIGEGVLFGVAAGAMGLAAYFFFARPLTDSPPRTSSAAAGFELDASARGAGLRWSTRF
jgi:hypothetical protein